MGGYLSAFLRSKTGCTCKLSISWEDEPGHVEEDNLDSDQLEAMVWELKRKAFDLNGNTGLQALDEDIVDVWFYWYDPCTCQPLPFPAFVVFRTASGWWSVERSDEVVSIQIKTSLRGVLLYYKTEPRLLPISFGQHKPGKTTVSKLLCFLSDHEELLRSYRLANTKNCQGFADRVFAFCTQEICNC